MGIAEWQSLIQPKPLGGALATDTPVADFDHSMNIGEYHGTKIENAQDTGQATTDADGFADAACHP